MMMQGMIDRIEKAQDELERVNHKRKEVREMAERAYYAEDFDAYDEYIDQDTHLCERAALLEIIIKNLQDGLSGLRLYTMAQGKGC